VVGDMHGVVEGRKPVMSSGARAGDLLVLTKGAGIEGTAAIAREKKRDLLTVFDEEFVHRAANYLFDPGLSIVPEARLALKFGVSAMHDPTEGGVAMGVYELAEASRKSVELNLDSILVRPETDRICARYELDPLGLLGSGALLATFSPDDAKAYVKAVRKQFIHAAVVGKVIPGRGKSKAISGGRVTQLSFSERDEVLKVLGE